MIEINLVPAGLRKRENRGSGFLKSIALPREILFGLGSIFFLVLIFVHVLLLATYFVKLSQQMVYKVTWQGMLQDKKNVDSIKAELKDLGSKMSTIADITSKRSLLWSQKLNILSDTMPKGVWLKKINWDNKKLVVEGGAYSKFHDEITIVGNFVSTLKKDDSFVKDFSSIELDSISRSKKGITEIADFKMTAKSKVVEEVKLPAKTVKK